MFNIFVSEYFYKLIMVIHKCKSFSYGIFIGLNRHTKILNGWFSDFQNF